MLDFSVKLCYTYGYKMINLIFEEIYYEKSET